MPSNRATVPEQDITQDTIQDTGPNAGHPTDPMARRLRRRSALAAWACRMAALAIPVALLASWGFGTAASASLAQLGLPPDHVLMSVQLAGAAAVSLLPALALGRSLLAAGRCFDGFARDDWFGPTQPRALAAAGRWLVLAGALGLGVPTVLGLVLSFNAAPGTRVLVVSLSSQAVLAVLFGALIWMLGHLWATARAVADENARFV